MKLKNRKTGEIADSMLFSHVTRKIEVYKSGAEITKEKNGSIAQYNSLAELCEEWTDYEEPKEFWHISCEGKINRVPYSEYCYYQEKEIGNYFETREEAEKAVRKLRAWKRLKDKKVGFYISKTDFQLQEGTITFEFGKNLTNEQMYTAGEDLSILFGGEE